MKAEERESERREGDSRVRLLANKRLPLVNFDTVARKAL